jgi:hypothetical protein
LLLGMVDMQGAKVGFNPRVTLGVSMRRTVRWHRLSGCI